MANQVEPAATSALLSGLASVAVVAANRLVRQRVVEALLADGLTAVDEGSATADVLDAAEETIDVLVMHCEAFGASEAALVGDLRSESPELRLVVVCASTNAKGARKAVDAGVDGVVLDDDIERAVAATVRSALAGQVSVPRALRSSVQKPSLSFREKQILGMVVMGFTNAEIGRRLYLAESTVKSHLSSAFGKLGVRSRSEAAAMILDPNGSLGTGILAITSDLDTPAT
jgi:DNA-binding NarL/FixJ family response regulator